MFIFPGIWPFVETTLKINIQPGKPIVGKDLRSQDLSGKNLSQAIIRMCVLDNARADSVCFDGARLEDSSAVGAGHDQRVLLGCGARDARALYGADALQSKHCGGFNDDLEHVAKR